MLTSSESLQEQIERYLNGQLTEVEKETFEKKAHEDMTLAKEIENHRAALFLIKTKAVSDLKNQLSGYSKVEQKSTVTPMVRHWYTWAAAASVIFAVSIFYYTTIKTDSNPDILFNTYFEPATTERQILRGDKAIDEKTRAFVLYSEGKYKEALSAFEKLIDKQSTEELLFYAGASALASSNTQKAIIHLSKVVENRAIYQWRGRWYLALAYLKAKKLNESKLMLQELVVQPNSYSNKAKDLLDELG